MGHAHVGPGHVGGAALSAHADTALDQLRLAQDQLRLLDKSAETAHDQLLVFLASAAVHACIDVAEELRRTLPPALEVTVPRVGSGFGPTCSARGWGTNPHTACAAPAGHRGQHVPYVVT